MADNFYSDYIKSLKEDFPNAEKAFAYFCEQSNYSSMEEFLEDYGYNLVGLEEYIDRPDYQKGMDDLYAETIVKKRRKGSIISMM